MQINDVTSIATMVAERMRYLARSQQNSPASEINAARDMIEQTNDPLKVSFTVDYAIGYIDALRCAHPVANAASE